MAPRSHVVKKEHTCGLVSESDVVTHALGPVPISSVCSSQPRSSNNLACLWPRWVAQSWSSENLEKTSFVFVRKGSKQRRLLERAALRPRHVAGRVREMLTVSFLCLRRLDFLRFCQLFQRFLESVHAGNLIVKLLKKLVSAEGIEPSTY